MVRGGTECVLLGKRLESDGVTVVAGINTWAAKSSLVKVGGASSDSAGTTQKYYRVQLGAYSEKSNADAMLAKVKAAGFTNAVIRFGE